MKCPLLLSSAFMIGLLASDCVGQAITGTSRGTPQTGASPATPGPKVASSTSSSKQFTVHGADLTARSTFILLCEENAATLGKLLKDDGRFLLPVVVVLKTPPDISLNGLAVATSISELSYGGFHFQMTVQLRNDFRTEDFTLELVRVLLAERILRNHQSLQTTRQRVLPDWLLTGVSEAMEFRSRARPSLLFSAVFKSGQVYSIDRIIDADPAQLDAMARGIYEASSCALVLTLLEQPDGPIRFTKFLDALAQDNQSDRDLLKKHFPTLGVSKNSLEKWWTLQMAALATPSALETLSVTETEALLNQALTLQVANYVEPASAPPKPETAKAPGLFHKTPAKEKTEESPPEEKAKGKPDKTEKPPSEPVTPEKVEKAKPETAKPEPVKEAPKPEPKKKALKEPKKPADNAKEESKETPPTEKTPQKPKTAALTEWDSWFDTLSMVNPFTGGREIAFPFRKNPKAAEEDPKKEEAKKDKPAENKPEAKPAPEKKPEKPEKPEKPKKPEKPEPVKTPEVVPTLPPKPAASRSVSGKPDELPAPAPPKEEPKKEESKPVEPPVEPGKKPGGFHPLGWFRKNTPGEKVEPSKEDNTKQASSAPSKPSPAANRKTDISELPIEDYSKIWKRADRSEILQRSMEQLNALKVRAHPLYKDVIGAYSAALQKLLNGSEKGMSDTFEQLHKRRDAIHETAKAVESHLDWFEASGTVHYSGTFNDYFKLRDELDKQTRPRSDALSQYLDAIEKEYEQ